MVSPPTGEKNVARGWMRGLLVCLAIASVMHPASTWAQEAVVEGPGYPIGEGSVLHPSVGIQTGFDSNVFHEQSDGTAAPTLRLRGAVSIASQGNDAPSEQTLIVDDGDAADSRRDVAPSLDFRLTAALTLERYLSGNVNLSNQNRLSNRIGGMIDGKLDTNPRGPTSFYLDGRLLRVLDLVNYESYGNNLNRVLLRAKTGFWTRPGGGALRLGANYRLDLDFFESADSDFANRIHNQFAARAEWLFLPLTRFYFDTSFGLFSPLSTASCDRVKRRSYPLRIQAGAASALTELTTVRGHIGYGKGFYRGFDNCDGLDGTNDDFSQLLFGAEIGHRYSPFGRITVAYEYDVQDSVQANFYRDHALLATVHHQVELVLIRAGLDLRARGYRGIPAGLGGAPSRDDVIVRLFGKGYYFYRDWLAFTGELDILSDQTDYTYSLPNGGSMGLSYNRVVLQLGAVAAF